MDSWNGTLIALGLGLTYIGLGYPMYRRKVRPNKIYGFRIRQTLNDPDVWYPVNARSGEHFMVTGGMLVALGLVSMAVAHTEDSQNVVMVIALGIALAGPLYSGVVGYRMAKALATRGADRSEPSA